jgi:hypothetical protein
LAIDDIAFAIDGKYWQSTKAFWQSMRILAKFTAERVDRRSKKTRNSGVCCLGERSRRARISSS